MKKMKKVKSMLRRRSRALFRADVFKAAVSMAAVSIAVLMACPLIAEEIPSAVKGHIAQHVKALGGEAILDQFKTLKVTGRYVFNGLESAMTIYRKRPNLYRFEITLDDGRQVVEGCNGERAWRFDTARPSNDLGWMEDDEARRFIEEMSAFDSLLRDSSSHEVALLGEKEVDGVQTHHLQVKFPSSRVQDWYLSQDDHSLVRKETSQVHRRHGDYTRVWYFIEYGDFEGWRFPTYVEREDRQFVRAYEVDQVEFNVDLEDAFFSPPEQDSQP